MCNALLRYTRARCRVCGVFMTDKHSFDLYVPLESSVATHSKITRLARRLRISRPLAVGHMATLWATALREAPNGLLPDAETVEALAQWDGDEGAFVAACLAYGLLDQVDDGLEIHEFYHRTHVLHAARKMEKKRAQTRERVRRHREKKKENDGSCNAKNVTANAASVSERYETHRERESNVVVGVGNLAAPDQQQNLPRNVVAMLDAGPRDWPAPTELEIEALAKLGDVHPEFWAYVIEYTKPRYDFAPWAYAARTAANEGHAKRWELSRAMSPERRSAPVAVAPDPRRERFRALAGRHTLGLPDPHLDALISLDEVEPIDDALAEYAKAPGASWAGFISAEKRRRSEADAQALAAASARGLFVPALGRGEYS